MSGSVDRDKKKDKGRTLINNIDDKLGTISNDCLVHLNDLSGDDFY